MDPVMALNILGTRFPIRVCKNTTKHHQHDHLRFFPDGGSYWATCPGKSH